MGVQVKMYNPFQFKTKGEMIVECAEKKKKKKNIHWTMS